MLITPLEEHLSSLYRLRQFGIKFGLDSINRLVRGLGSPHERFRSIHIAGTNGKGSIAAILSSVLVREGYKVGLYTSPHLVRFNERIRINGCPVSDDAVADAAEAVQLIYTQGEPPTFFECATAMALYHFAKEHVDWAILETGMGGRLDATNIVRPEVSIISNIFLDHQIYLGNTLAKIAAEKGGIIKEGMPVVTAVKTKNVIEVIKKIASEKNAPIYRLGGDFRVRRDRKEGFSYFGIHRKWKNLKIGLCGEHQITNAATALGALELLKEKGVDISEKSIYEGLAEVKWPGRLEIVSEQPLVVLDGAHNRAGIESLKQYLKSNLNGRRLTLVVGIMEDKSWRAMLRSLVPIAHRLIITSPRNSRAVDPDSLAAFIRPFCKEVDIIPRVDHAVATAIKQAGCKDAVCVAGSLYAVGEAKAYLENNKEGVSPGEIFK
ncbi:MAG: bifunctional folylpolyglutamate synthase/dihydrofolate synthase [Deltaproteobacteria bacterium]|nr:bifunctional folylpolyglutamate synthase/dihydrofolate synthase [Deltaproteobacteria bacterium]